MFNAEEASRWAGLGPGANPELLGNGFPELLSGKSRERHSGMSLPTVVPEHLSGTFFRSSLQSSERVSPKLLSGTILRLSLPK